MSPTRELALQTHKVVKELGRYTNLRLAGEQRVWGVETQFFESHRTGPATLRRWWLRVWGRYTTLHPMGERGRA